MRGRKRKADAKKCEWCGTRFRDREGCARGPACGEEQANHEALDELIQQMKGR